MSEVIMADDERTDGATATLEKPEAPSPAPDHAGDTPAPADVANGKTKAKKKDKKQKDIDEYEVEFETPFGKLEFEFEPRSTKERKDREKREKKEADAAKAAAKASKRAEQHAEKQAAKRQKKGLAAIAAPEPKRGGGNLLPILIIFALIATAIAVAIWLFARPGDDDLDQVPQEFLNDAPVEAEARQAAAPQGFVAKAQARVRDAVRAGKQASRETQTEQQKKFEDLTGQR
jgi:hypothetical protein